MATFGPLQISIVALHLEETVFVKSSLPELPVNIGCNDKIILLFHKLEKLLIQGCYIPKTDKVDAPAAMMMHSVEAISSRASAICLKQPVVDVTVLIFENIEDNMSDVFSLIHK